MFCHLSRGVVSCGERIFAVFLPWQLVLRVIEDDVIVGQYKKYVEAQILHSHESPIKKHLGTPIFGGRVHAPRARSRSDARRCHHLGSVLPPW